MTPFPKDIATLSKLGELFTPSVVVMNILQYLEMRETTTDDEKAELISAHNDGCVIQLDLVNREYELVQA